MSTAPAQAAKRKTPEPVISRITIRATDIFDFTTNPAIRKFPYTTINTLHIRTQEQVIRNALLFKVGDRVDPFLIRETERNLRALPFIRAARVSRFPQRDGTVALVVRTQDSWTTEPLLNLGGVNTVDEIETGFREKNFLGLGKSVSFLYKSGPDFIEREYKYYDPQLFNSRWQLNAGALTDEAGTSRNITVQRPFYSATTKWSFRGGHANKLELVDEFSNNAKVSKFKRTIETHEFAIGRKVGGGTEIVNHVGPRYRRENRTHTPIPETSPGRPIPESEHLQTLFLDIETIKNDYIELTRIEKMSRVEDYNLGPQIVLSPGVSPKALSGDRNVWEFETTYEQRTLIKDTHLLFGRLAYSGRSLFDRPKNQKYIGQAKYYVRSSPLHTLVGNVKAQWSENLDQADNFKLGGDTGLRAYKRDQFVGDRTLLMNVEDRMYFVDDAFNLVSFGAAVFADSGYAWPKEQSVDLTDLKSDIGLGLRMGLTRSSNEVVLRFDLAYRLDPSSPNDKRIVFTFGSSQAF
jgi:outer membrane protein assembly factor BamA